VKRLLNFRKTFSVNFQADESRSSIVCRTSSVNIGTRIEDCVTTWHVHCSTRDTDEQFHEVLWHCIWCV